MCVFEINDVAEVCVTKMTVSVQGSDSEGVIRTTQLYKEDKRKRNKKRQEIKNNSDDNITRDSKFTRV